jgi:hypothetical protein
MLPFAVSEITGRNAGITLSITDRNVGGTDRKVGPTLFRPAPGPGFYFSATAASKFKE